MKMWMSTRLCEGLHGSTINPVSLNRRQSRNMPRKTVVPRETAVRFLALAKQNRSPCSVYQTVQDEDSEETGEDVSEITTGTMRRFSGTVSGLKLSRSV